MITHICTDKKKPKTGLGRGLDSLFSENFIQNTQKNEILNLKISEIIPNKSQPRKEIDNQSILELASSIKNHGIIQPIVVRYSQETQKYELIVGERRWRAAKIAAINEIPAILLKIDDQKSAELALIENLQRENLTIIEEANGYKKLIENYGLTQEEVAKIIGKSRPTITNSIRILELPENILCMLNENKITAGHARALLCLKSQDDIQEFARHVILKELSVRALEQEIKRFTTEHNPQIRIKKNIFFSEFESNLNFKLKRNIKILGSEKQGFIKLEFNGFRDLDNLVKSLMNIKDDISENK
ncbi:MAG: ParB/RepB/Spo0J family partition protein [Candidatus Improbicoccus devescovinae]|nr:MAG: ParB/RepB/Spo0J family partition protein [Candidatus Improbicoccus devescovinae]